jgi:hypothetical protein
VVNWTASDARGFSLSRRETLGRRGPGVVGAHCAGGSQRHISSLELEGARVVPSKNPFLPFCPFYKRKWVIPNVTPFPSVQIMII